MTTLFRKSTSLATLASRRALAAFLFRGPDLVSPSLARHQTFSPPSSSSSSYSVVLSPESPLSRVLGRRWLHYSFGSCRFRYTEADWAPQHAVDDYSYEEKVEGKGARTEEGLEIASLGIAEVIVKKLSQRGITRLFPIQTSVLEPAMEGRDMIGRAKTGTGKTLAFGIPIMDKIIKYNTKHGRGRNPLTLVLAPTRELARQVEKEFRESSDLDTLCVYGGSNIRQQMSALDYGVDVVVGTPGRVIDLIKRGALNLSEVQFLVLDEADQMLAVGFVDDVEVILEKLPQKRQSMMFSATMPNWIRQLARKYLNDPLTIDLVADSDQKLAEGISLYSIASDNHGKASIIGPLVTEHAKGGKCIVFTQTKRDADRLACALRRTLRCEPLHGDISQLQRERTLSGFRDGRFNVLVATDVAARGLDIPNVDLVIHYDLPNSSEIFVHRSGRTGRAGKKGSAILIYNEYQTRDVRTIEQHVGSKFEELPRITVEGGASLDLFGDSNGGRFGSRSRGSTSAGRFGGFGGSFGRSGGYGDSGSGRSGFFGGSGSRRSDGFGSSDFGGSRGLERSGGFGNSGRSGGFGDMGRSGGFGDSKRSVGFDGSRRPGSFDDSSYSGSSEVGGSRGSGSSENFGGLGNVGRSRGFSNSEDSGGFGFGGSSHSGAVRSGGFGDSKRSGGFGDSDRSGRFGDSRRRGGFDDTSPNGFASGGISSRSGGGSSTSRFSFDE